MQTSSDDSRGGLLDSSCVSAEAPKAAPTAILRKLLLVDDEADGAECAAILLRSSGLQVTVAHSATEALQALQDDEEIDGVLADIMMPGMTGLQLADTVRALYPEIKIVLMSGYVLPELLKNREFVYMSIEKPYKIDELLKVLRS